MNLPFVFLLAATLVFAGAVVQALVALKTGSWRHGGARIVLMAVGFLLQTGFVYLRGQEVGQCPMKSLADILVFIAWSIWRISPRFPRTARSSTPRRNRAFLL